MYITKTEFWKDRYNSDPFSKFAYFTIFNDNHIPLGFVHSSEWMNITTALNFHAFSLRSEELFNKLDKLWKEARKINSTFLCMSIEDPSFETLILSEVIMNTKTKQ